MNNSVEDQDHGHWQWYQEYMQPYDRRPKFMDQGPPPAKEPELQDLLYRPDRGNAWASGEHRPYQIPNTEERPSMFQPLPGVNSGGYDVGENKINYDSFLPWLLKLIGSVKSVTGNQITEHPDVSLEKQLQQKQNIQNQRREQINQGYRPQT